MNVIDFYGGSSVVHIRQITLGEALDLSSMPQGRFETNTNQFLSQVVTHIEGYLPINTGLLPIDIRAAIVCHFIAYSNGFKDADFRVTDKTNYSDYLDRQSSSEFQEYITKVAKQGHRFPSPESTKEAALFLEFTILNGFGAEAWQNLCTNEKEWRIGLLALQLRPTHEKEIEPNLAAYTIYAKERIDKLKTLDLVKIDELMMIHDQACVEYPMLMWADVDDKGIVFVPFMQVRGNGDDSEVVESTTARFCVADIFAGRSWL